MQFGDTLRIFSSTARPQSRSAGGTLRRRVVRPPVSLLIPPVAKSRQRRVVAVTRSCLTNPDGRDILHCHQRTDPVRMLPVG